MAFGINLSSPFEEVRLAVLGLIRGEQNNTGIVELTTGTSTVVNHPNCAPKKTIVLSPTTASAAGVAWYIPDASVARGSFTIQHPAGVAGRIFRYELTGASPTDR